jgi:hypothetical protein
MKAMIAARRRSGTGSEALFATAKPFSVLIESEPGFRFAF